MLRIIQLNTLEDRSVSSKAEWDEAIKFLESAVRERLQHTELRLREILGPGTKERWLRWENATPEQAIRSKVKSELDKIIYSDNVRCYI